MAWLRRLIELLRGRTRDAALTEEMEAHRAFAQAELEGSGGSATDAAAESRRRMGNVLLAREDSRDVWMIRWLDRLRQNVRYGVRGLVREPLFALTAILTLGLGSAATITVFSVVDAEVWRPLPYTDPHRLVAVGSINGAAQPDSDGIGLAEFKEWRQAGTAFVNLAAIGQFGARTVRLDHAESVLVKEVTADYFATLGRKPLAGRVFADADADGSRVAVLSELGWKRLFNNDPAAIGHSFLLDGNSFTIIGLVARDDSMFQDTHIFLPMDERSSPSAIFTMIGRLAPGASVDAARAQLQSALNAHAAADPARRGHVAEVNDLSSVYRRTDHGTLFFFLGAAALVLMLTVANIAGLLVSRAMRRTPEFALRGALGGGTAALTAQTMVEGALVTIPGCLVGVVIAYLALGIAGQFVPEDFLLRGTEISLDLRAAAFTFLVAAATTAVLTLVPLGIVRRTGAREALGSGNRTGEAPRTARLRRTLLVGQLAVTVVLLAGAGMFVKSFVALTNQPYGFDPVNAWSLHVSLSGPSYSTPSAVRAYVESALEHLRAVPRVRSVAVATSSPLASGWVANVTRHESGDTTMLPSSPRTIFRAVGTEYFHATGTRIVSGRGFEDADRDGSPAVAIVNEMFVRKVFPSGSAIGKTVDYAGVHAAPVGQGTVTIVGVAANIKEGGMNEVDFADMYVPFAQKSYGRVEFVVRTDGADAGLPAALRAAIADPLIPVSSVSALSTRVDQALQPDRFNLIVVGAFATMAVLMSAIGVYGAMAYAASARRREFGVRLAMGATPRGLTNHMLWHSARLSLVAAALGLTATLVIAKLLGDAMYLVPGVHGGLLFNVKTTDPVAIAGAVAGVVLLAIVAGAVPARRVAKVNPVSALRAD